MRARRKGAEGRRGMPKNCVISFRVNAQEWEMLKQHSEETGSNVSNLLRSCIDRLTREEPRRL